MHAESQPPPTSFLQVPLPSTTFATCPRPADLQFHGMHGAPAVKLQAPRQAYAYLLRFSWTSMTFLKFLKLSCPRATTSPQRRGSAESSSRCVKIAARVCLYDMTFDVT